MYCYLQEFSSKEKPKPEFVVADLSGTMTPKPVTKTRIANRSKKRAKQEREYAEQRSFFLLKWGYCQAKLPGCRGEATDIHHPEGRMGDALLDQNNWLPVCRPCHTWIEEHPKEAKELGLSRSRLEKKYEHI